MACGVSGKPDPGFAGDCFEENKTILVNKNIITYQKTYRFIPDFDYSVFRGSTTLSTKHAIQRKGRRRSIDGQVIDAFSVNAATA